MERERNEICNNNIVSSPVRVRLWRWMYIGLGKGAYATRPQAGESVIMFAFEITSFH